MDSNSIILISHNDLDSIAQDMIQSSTKGLEWGMSGGITFIAFCLFATVIGFAIKVMSK